MNLHTEEATRTVAPVSDSDNTPNNGAPKFADTTDNGVSQPELATGDGAPEESDSSTDSAPISAPQPGNTTDNGAPVEPDNSTESAPISSAPPDHGMPVHPVCDCFPMMRSEAFKKLVADIKANGLIHPIVVHEGKIIDGRNRERACRKAGVTPVYIEWRDTGKMDVARWIWSTNVERRHLTADQIAAIQAKIHAISAREQAQQRKVRAAQQQGKHGKKGGRGHRKPSPTKSSGRLSPPVDPDGQVNDSIAEATTSDAVPEPKGDIGDAPKTDSGDVRESLAQDAGVSEYRMQQALNLQKEDPEMLEDVIAGKKKLGKASKEAQERNSGGKKTTPKKTRQAKVPPPKRSKCASDRLPAPRNSGVSTFDVRAAMNDAAHEVDLIFQRVPVEDQNTFIVGTVILVEQLRKSPVEIPTTCEVVN